MSDLPGGKGPGVSSESSASARENVVTQQQPEVQPGFGEGAAEDNGYAGQAREMAADETDQTQPPDEASTPA